VTYAALTEAVASLRYKPGWRVRLLNDPAQAWWPEDGHPLYLVIGYDTPDSNNPAKVIPIEHQFTVPLECGDWERWLLDRLIDAEHHEICEFFETGGRRPFYPVHTGPRATLLEDLYAIRKRA
jgi:hypothetical protein